ncbi:MAG: hypothetical protein BBJ57_02410 [Desulfobacterales bacterium PC51MH44]|nr:MAG: hypothetical protein BBJ57_02410 [Desulfobacterales bacterium PC51MH44]
MKMTPGEIMAGLSEKNRMLSAKNDEYIELIEKRAQAERLYNIAVAEKTIALKLDGNPATLIDKLVKGDKTVSKLKYEFDVCQGVEKACLNVIHNLRSAIDTYRSLLSWLKAELQSQ